MTETTPQILRGGPFLATTFFARLNEGGRPNESGQSTGKKTLARREDRSAHVSLLFLYKNRRKDGRQPMWNATKFQTKDTSRWTRCLYRLISLIQQNLDPNENYSNRKQVRKNHMFSPSIWAEQIFEVTAARSCRQPTHV